MRLREAVTLLCSRLNSRNSVIPSTRVAQAQNPRSLEPVSGGTLMLVRFGMNPFALQETACIHRTVALR